MGCTGCEPPVKGQMKKALPKNEPNDPIERPDGSLLFSGMAKARKGYIIDPKNPKRLIPDIAPCRSRINSIMLDAFGNISVMNQCNHHKCDKRGQAVTPEICAECPLRDLT